jgi:hypothetical protein
MSRSRIWPHPDAALNISSVLDKFHGKSLSQLAAGYAASASFCASFRHWQGGMT